MKTFANLEVRNNRLFLTVWLGRLQCCDVFCSVENYDFLDGKQASLISHCRLKDSRLRVDCGVEYWSKHGTKETSKVESRQQFLRLGCGWSRCSRQLHGWSRRNRRHEEIHDNQRDQRTYHHEESHCAISYSIVFSNVVLEHLVRRTLLLHPRSGGDSGKHFFSFSFLTFEGENI